ncbi:MAG: PhnD/SsuA/transferrin family substrate-binding protein [bacterium]|nr:PhnD/SsuA/transferrin family substrate-binding protein [bacterium]
MFIASQLKKRVTAICMATFCSIAFTNANANAKNIIFCINEGGTSKSVSELNLEYEPLAKAMNLANGQTISVAAYVDISTFKVEEDKGGCSYTLYKSIDRGAAQISDGKVRPIVKTKRDYVAGIIFAPKMTFTDSKDLYGKDILLPPKHTFTSALMYAYLNDIGIKASDIIELPLTAALPTTETKKVVVRHIKFQDAIAETVNDTWYQFGVVNPGVLKTWKEKKRGNFKELRAMPGWLLAANSNLSERDVAAMQESLLALNKSTEGRELLKKLKFDELVPATVEEYKQVHTYLHRT